jgi:hypothetical protein
MSRYEKSKGFLNGELMSVKEACNYLNMDASTLNYHFQRKRLSSFKINGKRYYTSDSIVTFLKYLKMRMRK